MGKEVYRCGVVILFDEATETRAIRLSREFQRFAADPHFSLGRRRFLPHLSLFHLRVRRDRELELAGRIEKVASLGRWVTGMLGPVRASHTLLFWETERTVELDQLHRHAVETLAPLRSENIVVSSPLTKKETALAEQYGYPFVLEAYHPHITLQALREEHAGYDGGSRAHKWRARSLALAELGRHGCVVAVRREISLL